MTQYFRGASGWIRNNWRPAMAVQYFMICMFDFMLAPIGLTIFCAVKDVPYIAWHPLTLESGGLYHVAMGAILGITSWTRGKEKLAVIERGGMVEKDGDEA